MRKLFKQLPIQILFVIVAAIVLTPFLSKNTLNIFYSISSLFKDALMLFLPILIFSYIFSSMIKFAKSAPMLILSILITITLSNLIAFVLTFFSAKFLFSFLDLSAGLQFSSQVDSIESLTNLSIPDFWSSKNGMLLGFVAGVALSFAKNKKIYQISETLKDNVTKVFNNYFVPLLPLFIFGFFVKLQYEGAIASLFTGYGKVLLMVIPMLVGYISFLFLTVNRFNMKNTIQHMKDSFLATLTGFTTTSSIASLPLMVKAAQKHTSRKDYVEFVIPAVINIHAIGDTVIFASMIVSILYIFNVPFPSVSTFMVFLYYYLLAKFSTAAVPAGGTLAVMPLTIIYLGFSYKMAAIFMTLGILQDCLMTAGNVVGNVLYVKFSYDFFGKKVLK